MTWCQGWASTTTGAEDPRQEEAEGTCTIVAESLSSRPSNTLSLQSECTCTRGVRLENDERKLQLGLAWCVHSRSEGGGDKARAASVLTRECRGSTNPQQCFWQPQHDDDCQKGETEW